MNHTLRKINNKISVKSLKEFIQLLSKIDTSYFERTFHKSKGKYLNDIQLLFEQIESDFHYVYVLKQGTHIFQLQWKESVLKAHLDLLVPNLPSSYLRCSVIFQYQAIS